MYFYSCTCQNLTINYFMDTCVQISSHTHHYFLKEILYLSRIDQPTIQESCKTRLLLPRDLWPRLVTY